jgi:hypothetical protein
MCVVLMMNWHRLGLNESTGSILLIMVVGRLLILYILGAGLMFYIILLGRRKDICSSRKHFLLQRLGLLT